MDLWNTLLFGQEPLSSPLRNDDVVLCEHGFGRQPDPRRNEGTGSSLLRSLVHRLLDEVNDLPQEHKLRDEEENFIVFMTAICR